VRKELGGDTAGPADPSRPKGCPIPCDTMLSNKSWGKKEGWSPAFLETAEHLPASGKQ